MSGRAELHVPVMLAEVVGLLAPALEPSRPGLAADDRASGTRWRNADARSSPYLVDCTLGLGGHAGALLTACPEAQLIGLDRDPQALALAREQLAEFADRVTFVEATYDELPAVLASLGLPKVQGILLDLGISSLQIDDPQRGFTYAQDAPLDMRMGRQDLTAAEVLNTYSRDELTRILRTYGEERYAAQIAGRIVAEREREPFVTSGRLVQLLYETVPAASRKTRGNPAKRTFQALRIEVNAELESLQSVLPSAIAALALDGRIAVLAYHSLEDRLVKQIFGLAARDRAPRDLPVVPADLRPELRLLTRGALRPSNAEIARNPRAASARLRAAVRIAEMAVAG
jgi:16S rRNA (cytosine1402-N4)-methyltransferase